MASYGVSVLSNFETVLKWNHTVPVIAIYFDIMSKLIHLGWVMHICISKLDCHWFN